MSDPVIDVRHPLPPYTGQPVTITFHAGPRQEQWGERITITSDMERVDSKILTEDSEAYVVGRIWWGDDIVFQSPPQILRRGDQDSFTFMFGNGWNTPR